MLVAVFPAASRAVTVSTFAPGWSAIPVAVQLVVPLAVPLPPRSFAHVTCVTPTLSAAVPPTVSELAFVAYAPPFAGVLIATVRPGSPAADAGLRGGDETAVVSGETWVLGGDIVVEADGTAIDNADQLREIVLAKQPGDSLSLRINRDGKVMTVNVKLGRQPTTPTG